MYLIGFLSRFGTFDRICITQLLCTSASSQGSLRPQFRTSASRALSEEVSYHMLEQQGTFIVKFIDLSLSSVRQLAELGSIGYRLLLRYVNLAVILFCDRMVQMQ